MSDILPSMPSKPAEESGTLAHSSRGVIEGVVAVGGALVGVLGAMQGWHYVAQIIVASVVALAGLAVIVRFLVIYRRRRRGL